jgi:hypothetical protein
VVEDVVAGAAKLAFAFTGTVQVVEEVEGGRPTAAVVALVGTLLVFGPAPAPGPAPRAARAGSGSCSNSCSPFLHPPPLQQQQQQSAESRE